MATTNFLQRMGDFEDAEDPKLIAMEMGNEDAFQVVAKLYPNQGAWAIGNQKPWCDDDAPLFIADSDPRLMSIRMSGNPFPRNKLLYQFIPACFHVRNIIHMEQSAETNPKLFECLLSPALPHPNTTEDETYKTTCVLQEYAFSKELQPLQIDILQTSELCPFLLPMVLKGIVLDKDQNGSDHKLVVLHPFGAQFKPIVSSNAMTQLILTAALMQGYLGYGHGDWTTNTITSSTLTPEEEFTIYIEDMQTHTIYALPIVGQQIFVRDYGLQHTSTTLQEDAKNLLTFIASVTQMGYIYDYKKDTMYDLCIRLLTPYKCAELPYIVANEGGLVLPLFNTAWLAK